MHAPIRLSTIVPDLLDPRAPRLVTARRRRRAHTARIR